MSKRLNDFLAREAGDYLARMNDLLAGPGAPDPDELLRLARGIRGSAQMADATRAAVAAEQLQEELRSVAAEPAGWDEATRQKLVRSVDALASLLNAREDDVIPISDLFHDDAGPHVTAVPTAVDDQSGTGIVPVTDLLYSGDSALSAAASLRPALDEAIESGDRSRSRALLDELFDLIRLGGSASP